jgi:SAM-dependent methyltransferase
MKPWEYDRDWVSKPPRVPSLEGKDTGNLVIYDLGCGYNKYPNSIGVDAMPKEGVDVVADIENLRGIVQDEVADVVVLSNVIEHGNSIAIVKEAHRILKVGGLLYVETPNAYDAERVIRGVLQGRTYVESGHVQVFGSTELTNLLVICGFELVNRGFMARAVGRGVPQPRKSKATRLAEIIVRIFPNTREVLWAEAVKPETSLRRVPIQ